MNYEYSTWTVPWHPKDTHLADMLNEMAVEGWKLHTLVEHDNHYLVILERPANNNHTMMDYLRTNRGSTK